jgi:hypothetical protein
MQYISEECMIGMKCRVAMMVLSCLFLVRCAAYYHMFSFSSPKSTFYTEKEKEILEKTVKSIDFDYGFDSALELDYVFPHSPGYTEFKTSDKELSRALEGSDASTLIEYNEKIYRLKKLTILKMEKYRDDGNWKEYTFINKYLLPPLDHYADAVEKQALKRDKGYQYEIDKRKKAIDRKVEFEIQRKEFEDIWKNDYNS